MVDFALQLERNEGRSREDAIYQACVLRFRPILMTTMAALLGAVPLMLGTGAGSEIRQPLGYAIVGGLLLSQILTLFTTPVVYLYLDRLGGFLRHKRVAILDFSILEHQQGLTCGSPVGCIVRFGHEQTSRHVRVMSVIPLKADHS